MRDLKDKVAVVTGGGSGIGLALARGLAAEGMAVVLADRDTAAADDAAAALSREGVRALAVTTDVTRPSDVENLANRTYTEFGAVHLLCNNAGVLGAILPSWQQPLQNWDWVMGVNFRGVVHGIHFFLPRMLEQGKPGYVLNTASIAGLITGPFFAPYNASKHAVVALSECLHHELRSLKSVIEVGVLCPGWVNTGLASFEAKVPPELRAANTGIRQDDIVAERDKSVRSMVSASLPPEVIASKAIEAIREGSFYIFPHQERKWDVEVRMRDVLDEALPRFGVPKPG